MPRSYAAQFRAMVVEQVRSGRTVAEVAAELELAESSVPLGPPRPRRPGRASRHVHR